MAQFPDELIDEALRIWQPQSPEPLSREDGRQILENLTGFFDVLIEWHQRRQAASPDTAQAA